MTTTPTSPTFREPADGRARHHDVVASPIGKLLVVADDDALVALEIEETRWTNVLDDAGPRDPGGLRSISDQLEEYFAGERGAFDVAIAPSGTPFQLAVWRALVAIPFGATSTYGKVATAIGRTGAARAVGGAVNKNPIAIVVPCHRVIGTDGSLTGFAAGLERKQVLLDLERDAAPKPA